MTAFILALGALPIIVTKVTDMIRNAIDPVKTDGTAPRFPKVTWNVVPFVVGVGICVIWEFNYAVLLPGLPPSLMTVGDFGGRILTGLGLGAVAGGWHELFDLASSKAKAARAAAAGMNIR
jgi:hypothetical protein